MMLFQRLIWCALVAAVLVGSAQWAGQRWQAVPLILAAEVFESQKAEPAAISVPDALAGRQAPVSGRGHDHAHSLDHGAAESHHHDGPEWAPADGFERTFWTWVANVLNAFSMALLLFAAMGAWVWMRGVPASAARLALTVAAAGWLSLHAWPALGLSAEVPGMEVAALGARQVWWCLAAVCAAAACAALAGVMSRSVAWPWRVVAAGALLALPFVSGVPVSPADPMAGFDPVARTQLIQLQQQFVWATHGMAVLFWFSLAVVGGWAFNRWLQPVIKVARAAAAPSLAVGR